MSKYLCKTDSLGRKITFRLEDGKKIRVSNENSHYCPEKPVCKIDTLGRVMTFKVKDGKKVRVTNEDAFRCKNIPVCRLKKESQFPCKLQKSLFTKDTQLQEYKDLKSSKKINYPKDERQVVAYIANEEYKEMKKELRGKSQENSGKKSSENSGKNRVKFSFGKNA